MTEKEKIYAWESEYENYKMWDSHRWAWEFLKRNKEFRDDCNVLAKLKNKKLEIEKNRISEKYGLKEFKHYLDDSGSAPKFLIKSIDSWKGDLETADENDIRISLKSGKLLVLFYVDHTLHSPLELQAQLESAKKALYKYRNELLEISKNKVGDGNGKASRRGGMWRKNYLRHLKVIDDREKNVSWSKIARQIFPDGLKTKDGQELDNQGIVNKFYKMMVESLNKPADYRKIILGVNDVGIIERYKAKLNHRRELSRVIKKFTQSIS